MDQIVCAFEAKSVNLEQRESALFTFLFEKRCARAEKRGREDVAVYHLKVSVGSRAGGQSALAKSDYIEREGRYAPDREEREHRESEHMPEWAKDDPRSYWAAGDEYERANGRLYREVQFALPKELSEGQRRELASGFAKRLTEGEQLPYTLAVHRGEGENPHAHLMFSERANDGIERTAEQWFKRYNRKEPEKGGARKSRAGSARDWMEQTREAWEQEANEALRQAGYGEQIDRRSLAERRDEAERDGDLELAAELSREPNVHLGPARHRAGSGPAVKEKLQKAARVERMNAAAAGERDDGRREVDRLMREIAGVERRLKETYDRVRTAIDERIKQAGRAIRAGSEAVGRAGRALGRTGAGIGRELQAGSFQFQSAGERDATTQQGPPKDGRTHHEIDRRLRRTDQRVQGFRRSVQLARGGFERTFSLIHAEAEQKRKQGHRWDRVEGRIESLIQGRVRSRDRGGPDR